MRSIFRRRLIALATIPVALVTVLHLPLFAGPPYAGRALGDVLREFQRDGVDLVFSSAVVRDEWTVKHEPAPGSSRDTLTSLLAPFDLVLADGPGGALLVVPAPPRERGPTAAGEPVQSIPQPSFITEIVVTPSRHTVSRQEQGARFAVTHDEALTAPSSGSDAGRIVQLLPGVTAPDNSAAFRIRGSDARDAAIILDGLELYDPYHLEAFQSPYSLIDGNSIDKIDLRAGGYTADLGDRHGGFVEIATLVPKELGGELEIGTLNTRFAFRSPTRSGAGAWLISARSWYADAVFNTTEIGAGENLSPRFQDLYVKGHLAVSPRFVFSAHGLLGYDRVEFVEMNEDLNESADAETRNANLWFRLLTAWSADTRSETTFSVGRIDKRRDGISGLPGIALRVDDDREVNFGGLRTVTQWSIDRRSALKAGLELRRLRASYFYSTQHPDDPLSLDETSLTPRGTSVNVFAAYRRAFHSRLTAEVGMRWGRQTYTDDNHLSPRFNTAWRPDDRSELRLAAGRFKQSQRIHELNVQDEEENFFPAETSEQVEISYERLATNGLRWRVDAYHRRLSNLRPRYVNLFEPVEIFPETATDREPVAPDKARLRGLELLLRSPAEQPIFWWVGYTLAAAEDRIDGRWIPRAWDQTQTVKILVGYRVADRWSIAFSGVAHNGWPTTPVSGEIVVLPDGSRDTLLIPGSRNVDRFPGYRRVDMKVRKSFGVPRGKLWLTAEIANLLNEENLCCVDEFIFEDVPVGPTRVARQFDSWLGIRPSFNLLWEF